MLQKRYTILFIFSMLLFSSCAHEIDWFGAHEYYYDNPNIYNNSNFDYEKRDLQEAKKRVNIDSEPKDAKVYIEGKYIGNTPITIELFYKKWDVYYKEFLCEYYVSAPLGNKIPLNDRPVRDTRTTFHKTDFEHRRYTIDIYKENYKRISDEFFTGSIQDNKNYVYFLEQEITPYKFPIQQQQQQQQIIIEKGKASSLLSVISDPSDADVYLDDSLIGTTPINNMKLNPGNYRLKVMKGNKSWEKNILLPEEGSLQIKAKPE